MTGHHAFEADYNRPADVVPDPHGHDAAEAPLSRDVRAMSDHELHSEHHWTLLLWRETGHPDICDGCKAIAGAWPKCRRCGLSGGKKGTRLWVLQAELQRRRATGRTTWLKQGERV